MCSVQFSLQRTRFGLWGESVGLIPDPYGRKNGYDTNLDRPDIQPLVESTLNNIRLLLQKVEQVDDRYGLGVDISRETKSSSPGPHGLQVFKTPFDRFKSQIKKNQKDASPWNVTKWAIHDEAKLREIVDRLREYVDGLESITKSLGLLADQRARLNDEIENISDVESLKLLRDSNSAQLASAQHDITETASRRLITVAESIFEQKALGSGSVMGKEDDSFHTANSRPPGLDSTINLFIPGSWPKSVSSGILGPRLASSTRPDGEDTAKTTRFDSSCTECLRTNRECERLPHFERCLPCDRSNLVCRLGDINEISLTLQDQDWQLPQNQRWLAEILRKSRPQIYQSFERGETDYGERLSAIKSEDEEHCQNTSVKLIAQAEVGSSSAKRMFLELRNIRTGKVPFVSAAPVGDSLNKVLASIEGPPETPYEGGVFWITIKISQNSLGLPLMKFQTRVYHPNISPQGHICADFGDKWNAFHAEKRYNTKVTSMWYRGKSSTPQWTLGALLTAICGLLASPDVDDPLVPEIAQVYLEDYNAYCENARTYTRRYATGERPDEGNLSFLEEEVEVEASEVITASDQAAPSQPHLPPRHDDDDKMIVGAIRDYDDQYPRLLKSPKEDSQSDTTDSSVNRELSNEGNDPFDDSLPSPMVQKRDEYPSENSGYEIPPYEPPTTRTEPRASSPYNFAEYFPSQRNLLVRHDETTFDGNMNLRIDTEIQKDSHQVPITLFHVRMYDLKSRRFSIRRYERQSGREVCHTNPSEEETSSEETLSEEEMTFNHASAASRAYSSGYRRRTASVGSIRSHTSASSMKSVREEADHADEEDAGDDSKTTSKIEATILTTEVTTSKNKKPRLPTNTTRLVFSNYAKIDLSRRGRKKTKRYDFEYWGVAYSWKRITSQDGNDQRFSFHLYMKEDISQTSIAHIIPQTLSREQVRAEAKDGGWIPPCSMRISDAKVLSAVTDVADVIICTGVVALIDNCIKSYFAVERAGLKETKRTKAPSLSLSPLKAGAEFISPKAMIASLFKRRG